jgi:hypothetical protein
VVLIDHSAFAPAAAASPKMRYLWKKLRDWILTIRFSTELFLDKFNEKRDDYSFR